MKKLFGQYPMTWKKTILFALATGLYTGLIMLVPFLKDTSFQDIGISYEWWVIFAVILVVNCRTNTEAMLKCFVFFLVSQPLVYLVEVAAGKLDVSLALHYYRYWFVLTLLCLPGGFLAFYVRKQDLAGSIVLGLGNAIQFVMGMAYLVEFTRDIPHHLLSALVSFASIAVMSLCIQEQKKYRLISGILVPVAVFAALLLFAKVTGRVLI